MKKKIYFIINLILPLSLAAQPVINNMEKFTAGVTHRYVNCNPAGVGPDAAGANNHWLFSLTPVDTTEILVASPGNTAYASKFPTANVALVYSNGLFVYYNQTTGSSHLAGFVDTTNAIENIYANTVLSSKRPIAYLDTLSDTFTSSLTANSATFTGGGYTTITADAWGMLHLPDNAYTDVLRVKIEIHETDSNPSVPPNPAIINIERTMYLWFHNNFASALLIWDSTNTTGIINTTVKKVSYLVDETIGVSKISNEKNPVTANITGNILTLNVANARKNYNLGLYNLSGQKLFSSNFSGGSLLRFEMEREPVPGIYIALLRSETGEINAVKIVKQ